MAWMVFAKQWAVKMSALKSYIRLVIVAISVFLPLGCNAQNGVINDMKSAEAAFNERARNELLIYMSLEKMFPNEQVRALAEAASQGDIVKINALVNQGVDVNARGTKNATVLFWALRSSNIKGFRTLLELGANPNVLFDDGGTVMHWAVKHENKEFLKIALQHGGDPNLKAGQLNETPIFDALGAQSEKIDILLSAGANANAQNSFGVTPTMLAAGRGRFNVVYKLLNHGADYRIEAKGGTTLIDMIADVRGRIRRDSETYAQMQKVIAWLEKHGAHIPKGR